VTKGTRKRRKERESGKKRKERKQFCGLGRPNEGRDRQMVIFQRLGEDH